MVTTHVYNNGAMSNGHEQSYAKVVNGREGCNAEQKRK